MKNTRNILIALFTSVVLFSACSKSDDDIIENPGVNEEELITTVNLIITNNSGFNQTFTYKVDNGIGSSDPTPPVIDDVMLDANTIYNVELQILNEAESPAENVTEEILEENLAHLFLFESAPASGAGSITFSNGNTDDNGEPLNQTLIFTTDAAGDGQLTVTLKHEPVDKNATTPASAGGETDAQAIFPVKLN